MLKKVIVPALALLAFLVGAFMILGGGLGGKPALPNMLQMANRPVLIAHRGAASDSSGVPENTLQSFTIAQLRGYHWIELDIQNSADGPFIVYHDRNGGAELPNVDVVSELTVSELQSYPIVIDGQPTDYTLPTLDSVVARFDTTMLYYFDMKKYGQSSVFTLADDIAEFINRRELNNNVFVASHRVAFITYLEFTHPEINTVLEGFNHQMASALDYVPRKFKPDMIAGYQVALDDSLVSFLRASGWIQRYITFHVDSANLKETLKWGIQYIMVDDGAYVDSLLELQK